VSALIARGATIRFSSSIDALDPNAPTIIATSAPDAARLVAAHAPGVSTALLKIRETNLVSVTAFYRRHPRDTRGFGILFPHGCGLAALGVLMNSDMFAGRSELRSETWIYGDASPDHVDSVRADATAYVTQDRFTLTGRDDRPVAVYPTTWAQRLPVYGPAVLEARARLSELPPWIRLCGNYTGKIGVSALVAQARELAATY
jgi:oxygen-dependent protoporphyrinogen oxidase